MYRTDTVYWIFSTLPQVLGALIGLSFTAAAFIYESLNEKLKESSYDEILTEAKSLIHRKLIRLLWLTAIAILIDVICLAYGVEIGRILNSFHWISHVGLISFWCIGVSVMAINMAPVLFLINFAHEVLHPKYIEDIIKKLSDSVNLHKNSEVGHTKTSGMDRYVFLDSFINFEKELRELMGHSSDQPSTIPVRSLVNSLQQDHVFDSRLAKDLNEIIRVRNLIVHGATINFIPIRFGEALDEARKIIESKNHR